MRPVCRINVPTCLVLLGPVVILASFSTGAWAVEPAVGGKGRTVTQDSRSGTKTAIFAGGCFWCTESDFEKAPGVLNVASGYSGGTMRNPTYLTYTYGKHREVILVTYDPKKVTYAGLVEYLLKHSNPVDRGGSFIDRGLQYSPAIYYEDDDEKAAAQRVIKAINELKVLRGKIAIAVLPRTEFWPAEDYHQDYHDKNPEKYAQYRARCGRDSFVKRTWGADADKLTLPGAYPEGVTGSENPREPRRANP